MNVPTPKDAPTRSRLARQPTRSTQPELELRRELWRRGLRYRLHRTIPHTRRSIDVAFPRERIAVFVDGCFWHRCPIHCNIPKNNRPWWSDKLEGNVRRDADTDRRLAALGWRVVRVWEHEPAVLAADRIEIVIRDVRRDLRSSE